MILSVRIRLADRLDCCKESFDEKPWPLSLIGTTFGTQRSWPLVGQRW
jgi:hypothetical protein